MADGYRRNSPLAAVARQGMFGAAKDMPGVTLSVRHPLSILSVIARAGKGKALKMRLGELTGIAVQTAGPEQYFLIAEGREEGALHRDLKEKLLGVASVIDQSHGRVVIRIAGPKARAVLAKGTPVDVHESVFAEGASAMTQMAHVGVHLTRVGPDAFDLSVFRGFSENFWEWLTSQAAEFGYRVT